VERRLDELIARLSERGRRITPQRVAILRVLAGSEGHPSAEQVHRAILPMFPTTSLATVYKTIHLLKAEGEILELEFSEFGNRYDGNKPYPHPHVICSGCGAIVDAEVSGLTEMTRRIAEETGFAITTHRLDFYGLCPKCRAERAAADRAGARGGEAGDAAGAAGPDTPAMRNRPAPAENGATYDVPRPIAAK
jgi:Fur family peroxide stress response transcriptional regulator